MSSFVFVALMMIGGPTDGLTSNHIAIKEKGQQIILVASHYGDRDGFNGREMANGEKMNAKDPTIAAHKHLPFGTKIILTNPETGKSQTVVVRDRGPYEAGRDIDVSSAAAKKLGFKEDGIARLEAKIIDKK